MDFQKIEKKWQKAWSKAKLGQPKVDKKKKKYFIHFAYPTVSGFMHTGHMMDCTLPDMIARYKRHKGFNVIFPVGSHASGNGAIAKAKMISEKDERWISELKQEGATEKDIKKVSTPEGFVDYFNKTYFRDWEKMGLICDMSRFTCTTHSDYSKFINWQFKKLNDHKLLIKKPYFANFCPNCGPVSVDPAEMDLQKGGNAEQQEFTLLKFQFGPKKDNTFIIAATLRPETVYGQTNMWANPNVDYSIVKVRKEKWIMSPQCVEKLSYQKAGIKTKGSIIGQELIGKTCIAPGIEREIIILPAIFCDPNVGTGLVTSVPSDSPYDYIALEDLKNDLKQCELYGLDPEKIKAIKVIPIINTKGYGDTAVIKICKDMGIKNQEDPKLEEATKEIYKIGFHKGKLLNNCGKYSGKSISEAKELMKDDLIKQGKADIMYTLSEDVICRCGRKVTVKKIPNYWFIKYSDKKLTKTSQEHAEKMTILPKDYYNFMPGALEWFSDRPCARQGKWLGTPFPYDKSFTIEAISDSTLYSAYYIVTKYVNAKKVKENQLTEEFFDYIFLGKGTAASVSKQAKVPVKLLNEINEEFNYWYPVDINFGGKEHKTVHFPPYIMNHVAILAKKDWPRGIISHGWLTGKAGEKFSKSKRNALLISEIEKEYGIDSMRLFFANISQMYNDIGYDPADPMIYRKKIERIYNQIVELNAIKNGSKNPIDDWLQAKVSDLINKATEAMEKYNIKEATDYIYSEMSNAFKWYARRLGRNTKLIKQLLSSWTILLAPYTPHIAEEIWSTVLKQKGFVSCAAWPDIDADKDAKMIMQREGAMEKVLEDVNHIKIIVKKEPKRICIYVIPPELANYKDAKAFYESEFGAKVDVFAVNDPKKYDPEGKSSKARPGKPGIYLE